MHARVRETLWHTAMAASLASLSEPWTRDDFVRSGMALWAGLAVLLYLSYLGRLGAMRRRLDPRDLVETAPERFALVQISRCAGLDR